jgi:hypothetical protein
MNNMGVKVSRSIKKFGKDIEQFVGKSLKEASEITARGAIQQSPVDTGAFVESWTISKRSDTGRGISTSGRSKVTKSEAYTKAEQNIASDLSNIPDDTKSIYLTNRAPHANLALAGPQLSSVDVEERVKAMAQAKIRFFEELRSRLLGLQ